ncbi:hypothetical protein [Pseudarthrobacter siccitolerans]
MAKKKTPRFLLASTATLCTAVMVCAGCSLPQGGQEGGQPSTAPATEAVRQDNLPAPDIAPEQFQTISGLGVNANVHSWKDGELRPAIDAIAELGDVTWRVIIDKADWELDPQPITADPSSSEHYAQIYGSGKMADLWSTVEHISSKPGQQVMVSVMGGVPEWMGGDHIDEAHEDQWVQMIASMVSYGRTVRGLDFKLLGPLNEADWNGIEGPRVAPEQYVRLMRKLIIKLDSLGLTDIRLVGPDTASAAKAISEYLPAMAKDDLVMSRLAHFAIHSYDGDAAGTREALQDQSPSAGFWVTEFSGPCPGCDSGSPNPTDWASAQASASYAIRLLQQGASGLQQYDAWDGYYEHHESMGYWGLLAYDSASGRYTPRKSYFVLRQLLKYLPRTAIRIAASSGDDRVAVVAFIDRATGRTTFFGQNTSDQPVPVILRSPQANYTLRLKAFSTDADSDMEQDTTTILSQGIAKYIVRPGAVFTLTGIPTEG